MEKLKPTHDHKLTDIVKVGIFALMLLLPFLVFLPNAFYYGFNEHAVVGQEETYYNFYQGVKNGKPYNLDNIINDSEATLSVVNNSLSVDVGDLNFDIVFETENIDLNINDKFYITFNCYTSLSSTTTVDISTDDNDVALISTLVINDIDTKYSYLFTNTYEDNYINHFNIWGNYEDIIYIKNVMIFNLTTIFGSGNEPTKEVFESYLTQDYYDFGNNYVIKDKGTNITWSMYNGWEDIWQTPLFNWTNQSILNTGLVAFTSVFGITKTSYITNLLTYELIIVSIYIVLDIVLTLFKWLTHIGQKE